MRKVDEILKKAKKTHKHFKDDEIIEETIYWFNRADMGEFILAIEKQHTDQNICDHNLILTARNGQRVAHCPKCDKIYPI